MAGEGDALDASGYFSGLSRATNKLSVESRSMIILLMVILVRTGTKASSW
jgi:hypothetical protein